MVSGVLFLDLKKAFDCLNHNILLSKLWGAGLMESSVDWFRSYLVGRTQLTKVNGVLSEERPVQYGVPQGSILGPLLFVMYINDLPQHLGDSRVHLYADDTAIMVTAINLETRKGQLNSRLTEAVEWMNLNHLTLNLAKCKVMMFGTGHTLRGVDGGSVNVAALGTTIEVVEEFKYLGVILDPKMNFSKHADYIARKCSSRLRMLGKTRKFVTAKTSLILYKKLTSACDGLL